MGHVFEVQDLRTPQSRAALKLLHNTDPGWSERFRREFSILSVIRHPNIVPVFDYGVDRETGIPYYTAEFLRGETLAAGRDRWEEAALIELLVQMSRALHFIHSRGLVHGDMKPGNILRSGARNYVLVDFGLAAKKGEIPGDMMAGTPKYMPPETFSGGEADKRSDLFSLGVTIAVLACGKRLRGRWNQGALRTIRPDISKEFESILAKLTDFDPNARFQSAAQIIESLNRKLNTKHVLITRQIAKAQAISPTMVGRQSVLNDIVRHLAEGPSLLFATGSFGIGKSRLLAEVRRALQLGSLGTTCISCGGGDTALRILEELARDLDVALPEEVFPAGERYESLASAILAADGAEPHAMILDDVDLLPPDERKALLSFFRRAATAPQGKISLLASLENPMEGDDTPSSSIAFRLDPLSAEEIQEYFESFHLEIHPDVSAAIAAKSAGNPLMVEFLAQQLIEQSCRIHLPEAAEQVRKMKLAGDAKKLFASRVASISGELRRDLELIAIADSPLPLFLFPTLRAFELFSSNLVRSEAKFGSPCLTITNDIVRSLILERLSSAKRRELHGVVAKQFGRWIEESEVPLDDAVMARHLLQSDPPTSGLPFLERALRRQHAHHANHEALSLIGLAASLLHQEEDNPALDEIRSIAADIFGRVGDYASGLTMLSKLRSQSASERLVVSRRIADIQVKARDFAAALKSLSKAETLLADVEEPEKSEEAAKLMALRQIIALFQGRHDLVVTIAGSIEALGDRSPMKERILALTLKGHVAWEERKWSDAKTAYEVALRLSEEHRYTSGVSMALGSLARLEAAQGGGAAAVSMYQRAIAVAEKAGDVLAVGTHHTNIGQLFERVGGYQAALRAYDRAIEVFSRISNRAELANAHYHRGRLLRFLIGGDAGGVDLSEALSISRAAGLSQTIAFCLLALPQPQTDSKMTKTYLTEAGNWFAREKNSFGSSETALRALELGVEGATLPKPEDLGLDQRVRLFEWAYTKKDGRVDVSAEAIERIAEECREEENPEEFGGILSLKARMLHDQGDPDAAAKAATEALSQFHQLSAELDESLQEPYLELRRESELKHFRDAASALFSWSASDLGDAPTKTSVDVTATSRLIRRAAADVVVRFLDIAKVLNTETDSRVLAAKIVDTAIDLTQADRGFLVLRNDTDFEIIAARNIDHLWIRDPAQRFSRSLVERVLETGQSTRFDSSGGGQEWSDQTSIVANRIQAVLCAPVRAEKGWAGALYLDRTKRSDPFEDLHMTIVEALGENVATSLDRARMIEGLRSQLSRIENLKSQLESSLSRKESEVAEARGLLAFKSREENTARRFPEVVATSTKMRSVLDAVDRAAESSASVCIYGESGTGKEVIARAIHRAPAAGDRPFIAVNCAAVPHDLFEATFFGHEKGAFTSARDARMGLIVLANRGTLFLDEVSELPLDAQPKLLRVLEDLKVRPVGGSEDIPVSVRVIAASNRNLEELVREKRFREDLFYRLQVIQIEIPPLRERSEDIPLLIQAFLKDAADRERISKPLLDDDALVALIGYRWPGNVRQLKNEIERAVAMLPKGSAGSARITQSMFSTLGELSSVSAKSGTLGEMYDEIARQMILDALKRHAGNKTHAAENLGVTRRGLRIIMERVKIPTEKRDGKMVTRRKRR